MIFGIYFAFVSVLALDNGVALTPPMGWMAWEQFRCVVDCTKFPTKCISEKLFIDMIDHIASDGWLEAGYEFVNIDDCWMGKGRDEDGKLYADPERFPRGIEYLADYAHKKKVKLGIYNDYGTKTCEGYTGSAKHVPTDAKTFGKWKVDMLKMDGCYSKSEGRAHAYPRMARHLNETGRRIVYSCSWPAYDKAMDYAPLPPSCNLWRNWDDIRATWGSVISIIDKWGDTPQWAQYAGPGHFNDPDQLVIGMQPNAWTKKGLTQEESRTQMAIWAVLAAPLIMSNDLRNVSAWAKEILTNREVIAVDQDRLGKQGRRLSEGKAQAQVWVRRLAGKEFAVAFLNKGKKPVNIGVEFAQFSSSTRFSVRDLWHHQDLGLFIDRFAYPRVAAHDTALLRLTPQDRAEDTEVEEALENAAIERGFLEEAELKKAAAEEKMKKGVAEEKMKKDEKKKKKKDEKKKKKKAKRKKKK